MEKRIYVVRRLNEAARLVHATSRAAAIRHVAQEFYSAQPATAMLVAELMSKGATLEEASFSASAEAEQLTLGATP